MAKQSMVKQSPAIAWRRQRITVAVLCSMLLLTLSACKDEQAPSSVVPAVYTQQVQNQSSVQSHRISAAVQPRYETQLAFRVSGNINKRVVEVGQRVERDQLLLQLDDSDYRLALAAAQQELRAAEADANLAESDAKRSAQIFAKALLGRSELERQQSRAIAAKARLQQATKRLQLAANQLQYTELRAPMSGVVTTLQAEPGQVVREGQVLLTLADPTQLDIVADIPETLREGLAGLQASAQLSIAGSKQQVSLRLRETAPKASERARTFRARFQLEPGAAQLPAADTVQTNAIGMGTSAELWLSAPQAAPVANLPAAAVLATHGQATVWLVHAKSGALHRRPVQLISQNATQVQVSGLQNGELVVVVGGHKLDEQMTVQPVPLPLAKFQERQP